MQKYLVVIAGLLLAVLLGAIAWQFATFKVPPARPRLASTQSTTRTADADDNTEPDPPAVDSAAEAAACQRANPAKITGSIADHVAAIANVDPSLVAWLREWEMKNHAGKPSDPGQQTKLEELLAASPLPFSELFGIGDAAQTLPGPDTRFIASMFYGAAVRAAEKDLAPLDPHGDAARLYNFHMHQMWNQISQYLDAESWDKIWTMQHKFDSPGSDDAIGSEMMMNISLMRRGSGAEHKQWMETALANFRAMLARNGGNDLSSDKKSKLAMCAAESLMSLQRPSEAVTVLEQYAPQATGDQALYIGEHLVNAKLGAGDIAGARQTLDQLKATPDLPERELNSFETRVKAAEKLAASTAPANVPH